MSVKEISTATGRAYSTVKQNIEKLGEFELVLPQSDVTSTQWRGVPADHEQLMNFSILLGTNGKAVRRKDKHMEERQKWASLMLMKQKERYGPTTRTGQTNA